MKPFPSVGLIAKRGDARIAPTLLALCRQLQAQSRGVLLDPSAAQYLSESGLPDTGFETVERDALARRCQLVIVIGGDGTMLEAGRLLAPAGVPILGVNRGRLGFMVDVRPEHAIETLREILDGRYIRERRLMLTACVLRGRDRPAPRPAAYATEPGGLSPSSGPSGHLLPGGEGKSQRPAAELSMERSGPYFAVNDVVMRHQAMRVLEFETWLGEEFISRHRADGVIVATPTGSTAYALSGGGPVLHPELQALALVPICPHTLSDRPLVVSTERPVRIVLGGAGGTRALCTCDGQTHEELAPGDAIEVRIAEHALHLIHPHHYSYFGILRDKLQWGRNRATPSNSS